MGICDLALCPRGMPAPQMEVNPTEPTLPSQGWALAAPSCGGLLPGSHPFSGTCCACSGLPTPGTDHRGTLACGGFCGHCPALTLACLTVARGSGWAWEEAALPGAGLARLGRPALVLTAAPLPARLDGCSRQDMELVRQTSGWVFENPCEYLGFRDRYLSQGWGSWLWPRGLCVALSGRGQR